jgi:vitamin B12 transporter
VISIITKKGDGPPKATGLVEGGSFGTFNQIASLSGGDQRGNYAFTAAHFRTASAPVTPLELLPPGRPRINDSYDNWTYSAKLGANLTEDFVLNWVGRFTDATVHFTGDDFSVFPAVPNAMPPLVPLALALATPARTRSTLMLRSNSANTPLI